MEQRPRNNGRDERDENGENAQPEETPEAASAEVPSEEIEAEGAEEAAADEPAREDEPGPDLTETVDVRHVVAEEAGEAEDATSRWFGSPADSSDSEGESADSGEDEAASVRAGAASDESADPAEGAAEPPHDPAHHARSTDPDDASEPAADDSSDAEPPHTHHARPASPEESAAETPGQAETPRAPRPSRPTPPPNAANRPPRPGVPGAPAGRPPRPGPGMPQGATPRGPRPPLPPGAGPRGPRPFVTPPPRAPHGAPGPCPPQGAGPQGAAGPHGRRPHHPSIERQRLQAAFWPPRLSRNQLVVGLLLASLGAGLAFPVPATNTRDQLLRAARPDDLVHILDDTTARGQKLDTELRQLEAQKAALQNSGDKAQAALQQAQQKAKDLQILAGTTKATGPGITVTITDPQHKVDAAALLNALQELRAAGAEVVQLDSVRIVVSSSFLDSAAGQVSVDGQVLTAPYVFKVIGDPSTLQPALGIPGGVVANLKSNYGASTVIATNQHILVDAVAPQPNPQYASGG